MVPSLRRAILALLAIAVFAVPAAAGATTPDVGHYGGAEGVGFVVGQTEHGSPYVDAARYHGHTGFERAFVHAGSFETCARVRINSVLFRDLCISGSFGSPDHASGTVKIYMGAHGHRATRPSETHHWSAALG